MNREEHTPESLTAAAESYLAAIVTIRLKLATILYTYVPSLHGGRQSGGLANSAPASSLLPPNAKQRAGAAPEDR
jgi:hypothetical protein